MASADDIERLNAALRTTASRAAELAGGGASLLFAHVPGEESRGALPRLRAAAGFASLDDARSAANEMTAAVGQAMETSATLPCPGSSFMGPRAAGGCSVIPLSIDGHTHGVLAVGFPDPADADRVLQMDALAQATAIHLDYSRLKADVEQLGRAMLDNQSLVDEKGDELLKMSEELFAQDIELLRNNEKLGQIEKLKSDFIEKMSRELRTPLNNIIEAVISVLAGENESISESAQTSLRGALDEGTSFQRTLQNILDLWQIKQGELGVEIQEVNFSEVIDEAIFSVQDELEGRPVEIRKELQEPFPKIRTDLTKVNQVLFLLLENAAKFTTDGTVTIRGKVIDDELHCTIEDTGIGICPDDLNFIYDEFFQVDERSSTRYRGAGLGLTLVKDLLTLMSGSCDIKSEAGHGTIAGFTIPIQISS